jgi:hypothetical protein
MDQIKIKDGFAHESKNNSGPCGIDGRAQLPEARI